MIPLLLAIAATQLPSLPYADLIEDNARQLAFQAAHNALNDDAELLDHHRGLADYFEAHPLIALSEQAYLEQIRIATFRNLTGALEESLRENPAAYRRFRSYYAALAQDAALSSRVDSLDRIGLRDTTMSTSIAYLKSHPDEAQAFLKNPLHSLPTPAELYPLRNRFRTDRDLQSELRNAFTGLDDSAAAHAYVFPWWKSAFSESNDVGQAYRALNRHFSRYAHRYWIWHRRNAAWAPQPHEQDWLNHHYALIRRNPGLRNSYYDFLSLLQENPTLHQIVKNAWLDELEKPSAWPPEGTPPELNTLAINQSGQIPKSPTIPTASPISRPTRPTRPDGEIRIPERPTRPQSPAETRPHLDFE